MICGIRFESITAWIWSLFPAVMLEIVQHASFLIDSFGDLSSGASAGSTPALMTIWVCKSLPVTMFPTALSAGVCTSVLSWPSSSTSRLGILASTTAWIASVVPSLKYEIAQHASISVSTSTEKISLASVGSALLTICQSGCGFFPRHKLESVHVAVRISDILEDWNRDKTGSIALQDST
ncbi:hypothetical protein OGATHE_002237 [Ogataea polymorpha]|uniref:Uncharacterized protein n=1 Tax=Ogataea polymorpha TaxID=460523 RepID=A0A9P8PIS0_9ASCO|nr:hypothetical protein OGATHE_002237 [Ogataea polymorpha]